MYYVIRFPDATTIHPTPELSQLGKNVPGVLNVAYDAQVPRACQYAKVFCIITMIILLEGGEKYG